MYKSAQNQFDKLLRKTERTYNRNLSENIEKLQTKNPTKFWEYIKKLGPRTSNKIPTMVKDDKGNYVTDSASVLNKWKKNF